LFHFFQIIKIKVAWYFSNFLKFNIFLKMCRRNRSLYFWPVRLDVVLDFRQRLDALESRDERQRLRGRAPVGGRLSVVDDDVQQNRHLLEQYTRVARCNIFKPKIRIRVNFGGSIPNRDNEYICRQLKKVNTYIDR
jgi:hypothetical protein